MVSKRFSDETHYRNIHLGAQDAPALQSTVDALEDLRTAQPSRDTLLMWSEDLQSDFDDDDILGWTDIASGVVDRLVKFSQQLEHGEADNEPITDIPEEVMAH